MSIGVRQVGSCSVVGIEDRFDPSYASWLGHSLTAFAADEPGASLVIDLSEVAPIEPDAVAALWGSLERSGVPVAIVNKRLTARRLVRRLGGTRLLVFPTVAMAVDALVHASGATGPPAGDTGRFRHEAFLYEGAEAFVEGVAGYVAEGVDAGEPVLVAVGAEKLDLLREHLGPRATDVRFQDMEVLGANPARIIPVWQAFSAPHLAQGRTVRGVGEPIWSGRSDRDLIECQHHESLLNLAFADSQPWSLLCPYDVSLGPGVLEEARRSHPEVLADGAHQRSATFLEDRWVTAPFDGPLPPVPGADVDQLEVDAAALCRVAPFVAHRADVAGLWPDRVRDLARAAVEVVTNSVVHGGGQGRLRVWRDGDDVVCEVRDAGHIADPLVGRRHPELHPGAGRGLWLANELCDLVQIRSSASAGTVVRLIVRRR